MVGMTFLGYKLGYDSKKKKKKKNGVDIRVFGSLDHYIAEVSHKRGPRSDAFPIVHSSIE